MHRFLMLIAVATLLLATLFYLYEISYPTHLNFIELQNTRFGPIRVIGEENRSGKLIIVFVDAREPESINLTYFESLSKKGNVIAFVNIHSYLKNTPTTGTESKTPCYEYAGEISRLSQVLQNNLKMQTISNAFIIGDGETASAFVFMVHKYLQADFLGTLSLALPYGYQKSFEMCSVSEFETFHTDNFPINILENPLSNSEYRTYRFYPALDNENSLPSLPKERNHSVNEDFLICQKTNCPLLDLFLPSKVEALGDLPLIETIPKKHSRDYFVIFLSGDGGWASIDKEIGGYLSTQGIPVIGFDSLKYFWRKKNPDRLKNDLSSIISQYQEKLHTQKVVLIGFSLGANMLPFVLSRLPESQLTNIVYYSLLAPSVNTEFEVHFADWLPGGEPDDGISIAPELSRTRQIPASCIWGLEEEHSLCQQDLPLWITKFSMNGSHHFDGDYKAVAQLLLKDIDDRASR